MTTKKPVAKKPGVKKPAVKKSVAPKAAATKPAKAAEGDLMVLYTIRMQPGVIDNIKSLAAKQGITHAAVARNALNKAFA